MKTRMIFVRNSGRTKALFAYFTAQCHLAKNLQNTANFYIRNLRTGLTKEPSERTDNENEVIRITMQSIDQYNQNRTLAFHKAVKRAGKKFSSMPSLTVSSYVLLNLRKQDRLMQYPDKEHWMPSYEQLNAILYWSGNQDYFALPSQANQQILRKVIKSWMGYFAALAVYREHPERFLGMPKAPGYKRSTCSTLPFTNQIIKLTPAGGKNHLSFPGGGLTLCIGKDTDCVDLAKVEVKPYGDGFHVLVTYKADVANPIVSKDPERILGLDCGIDNFMTGTTNFPCIPFIIDGKWIKSENRYFNKRRAELLASLTRGSDSIHSVKNSRRLDVMSRKRSDKMRDYFYKASYWIVRYCRQYDIEVIVCGSNKGQKQNLDLGNSNNQNFIQIPTQTFFGILQQVAAGAGIPVIFREESYTSKASLIDGDPIPVYVKGCAAEPHFSGKRIKRGLYQANGGIQINADVNGAGNIIRKEYPHAFDPVTDWSYLYKTASVITRDDLCHGGTHGRKRITEKPGKHYSYNRKHNHNMHWDRKLEYMELFGVTKKSKDTYKKQPVQAA